MFFCRRLNATSFALEVFFFIFFYFEAFILLISFQAGRDFNCVRQQRAQSGERKITGIKEERSGEEMAFRKRTVSGWKRAFKQRARGGRV